MSGGVAGLLAEVVHHVRLQLQMPQLSKAVHLFSRNVHDSSLPLTVQTTSIRLLMNLVEGIYHKHNQDQDKMAGAVQGMQPSAVGDSNVKGRKLLVRILDTFVRKFGTLKEYTKKLCEAKGQEKHDDPSSQLEFMPFRSGSLSDIVIDISKEIADCKQLIKTLIVAVRTVVWSVSNVKGGGVTHMRGMKEHECLITAKLLKHGLKCFSIYTNDEPAGAKEEKEILELFAGVFTVLDERTFRDVFTLNLQILFEHLLNKDSAIHIPQHFLSNQQVTKIFTDILLNFLVARIKDLSNTDKREGQVILNLFRIIFHGISTYPENEAMLKNHVRTIVIACLKHAMQEKRPTSYYQLLKNFFRSVSSGKFELLQKEFIQLLKNLIENLCKLLKEAQEEDTKELLVELCLTVPARLNFLLPHIHLLMKPLVQALNGSNEMVHLGLKKLETWVENLQPNYLDPLLQTVKDDLMPALYKQLQSGNNIFAVNAIRILGKLGGRNRRLLRDQVPLEGKDSREDGLLVCIQLPKGAGGSAPVQVALDDAVKTAAVMLERPAVDIHYKRQALLLIKASLGCLLPVINLKGASGDEAMAETVSIADDLKLAGEQGVLVQMNPELMSKKGKAKQVVCGKVLSSIFVAATNPDLAEECKPLVDGVCRYFAVATALCGSPPEGSPVPVYKEVVMLDVCIEALCMEQRPRMDKLGSLQPQPLQIYLDYLQQLCTPAEAVKLPVYEQVTRMLCHLCYQRPWWQKVAGCVGLQILVARMPVQSLLAVELSLARALLAIWKDSTQDEIALTSEKAYATLSMVLRKCHTKKTEKGGDAVMGEISEESPPDPEYEQTVFKDIVNALSQELASLNSTVRSNVQKLVGEFAQMTGKTVAELLEPCRSTISQQIFKRRLINIQIAFQIGHLDALTFCLSLKPAFLANEEQLKQLLQDALHFAEMEDQQVMRSQQEGAQLAQLATLRTHCVQLLRTAMASPEVNLAATNSELRNSIILMFFKVITKGFPDAVIAAREGLAEVLQTQRGKAPFKDLLQSSLRPVLVNLADYRKLNVPLLEGLSRLLELLSSWFNVTLGEKLLDYLQKWAEPDKSQPAGAPKPQPNKAEEPKIPAAIIELFHLLPPAPEKFMEKLAKLTIDLEDKLVGGDFSPVRSPYRAPFTKFLNRFPTEALDFFYERLRDPQFCKLFQWVLRSELASPLRDEVKKSEDKLLKACFLIDEKHPNVQELRFQGITMVRTMCKFFPEWLDQCPKIRQQLLKIWQSKERAARLGAEEGLELEHLLESKKLVKCLLSYARCKPSDHEVLFQMLTIFTVRSIVDYSFLKQFYAHEVANGYRLADRKAHILKSTACSLCIVNVLGH
jgi:transformation/transcription domain-associated protein